MVGAANDPAEHEADRVAERVVTMAPLPAHADPVSAPRGTGAVRRASVSDQPSLDAVNQEPALPTEQADIDLPKTENVDAAALGTDEFAEIEAGQPEDIASGDLPPDAAQPARVLARRETTALAPTTPMGPEGGAAPSDVAARIAAPGPGRAMPAAVRAYMEPRFGADFSAVRLHDRPNDRATAAAIGARAFAYGNDIWLGDGERADDHRLIAHELTHVVQQTGRSRSRLMAPKGPAGAAGAKRVRRGLSTFLEKQALGKIDEYARQVPGYTLLTVILGRNPLTGETVVRNADSLMSGLLGLIPVVGPQLYARLKETRALETAYEWVMGKLPLLNVSLTRVQQAINKAQSLFSLRAPVQSIKPAFRPIYDDLMTLVSAVKDKVLEFIVKGALKLAGPYADQVWGFIKAAGDTLKLILDDPLQFAKNLFSAVGRGFGLFFSNIGKHLKKGLLGFLFGSLEGLDLQLPDKMDLKGIISIVFQILGLTWQRIRKVLVKRLKPHGERKVAFLEKSVDVIKLLVTKGVMGVWQKLLGMIENLRQTVIGGITEFVIASIVKASLTWIAGLSNPVGAIIKVVLTIYNFIVAFLERLQQIAELVKTMISSVGAIARGQIESAAKFVEDAMGRTVPLFLAFLAAVIPVSGVTAKIQSIIKKLRKPVDKAVDRFVKFLVKKAKKLLAKLAKRLNSKRKLPAAKLTIGKAPHTLYAKKRGKRADLYIRTQPDDTDDATKELEAQLKAAKAAGIPNDQLLRVVEFIRAFATETEDADTLAERYAPDSATPQTKTAKALAKEINEAGIVLTRYGVRLKSQTLFDTNDPQLLLRFAPNLTTLEGRYGSYSDLSDVKGKRSVPDQDKRVLELDHNPPRGVLAAIQKLFAGTDKSASNANLIYFQPQNQGRDPQKAVFGRLSNYQVGDTGGSFPVLVIYGPYNNAMGSFDKTRADAIPKSLEKFDPTTPNGESAIQTALMEETKAKYDEVVRAYANEPAIIRSTITNQRNKYYAFVREVFKLPGTKPSAGDEPDLSDAQLIRGHARQRAFSGPNADFLDKEGKAGIHNNIRGETVSKFTEADHNPPKSEINAVFSENLDAIIPSGFTKLIAASKPFRDHTQATAKKNPGLSAKERTAKTKKTRKTQARRLFHKIREQRLRRTDLRSDAKLAYGGAVIISAAINQHPSMGKEQVWIDKCFSEMKSKLAATSLDEFIAGDFESNKAKQRRGLKSIQSSVNGAAADVWADRIVKRQQQIFDLYRRDEAPRVQQINEAETQGTGERAVGVLARIAARQKSSGVKNTLKTQIDTRYFPTH